MGFFDNIKNIFNTDDEKELSKFLLNYMNKKLTTKDVANIVKKINTMFDDIKMNNNFSDIIKIALTEKNVYDGLYKKIDVLINDLNLEKSKYEKTNIELEEAKEKENTDFSKKYTLHVQNKYLNYCKKVEEISRIRTTIDKLNEFDMFNRVFYTLKNKPTKTNFETFEKLLVKEINTLNNIKFSIYNDNVSDLIKDIPNFKKYNSIKDYEETSIKYKKELVLKFANNLVDKEFKIRDINFLFNLLKSDEENLKESEALLDRNIKFYKIDINKVINIFDKYVNQIKQINNLEDMINYYIDKTNKNLYNINKIDDINEIFGKLNKFVNNNEDKVNIELKNSVFKLISKIESYDILFRNYYPTEKTFKEYIKVIDVPIKSFDKNNFDNRLKTIENEINNKEIIENEKFKSFYV